ncbi:Crp/Fnr family transcriptional regulator [Parathalassolituus penaei]|uniref:Crp/Fnr family transcriptional regulator n=1 Tax=Parathalassolituus penaei TaxID=2997323 RepID=A0A9X3IRD5_9GAMM|nr:Crp/Fnr family transcriptional regulator [Parathalassolituus penaei]MCY0964761.1 Crp/Fnr family transcriptional regulator [Parathalassolituus penaei]
MFRQSGVQSTVPSTPGLTPQRLALLQSMPIFGALNATSIAFIESHCRCLELEAGQVIFYEGDPASSLFVLEQGTAEVMKQCGPDLRRLRWLHDGDCFGEMAIVDMNPRGATVRTTTPCKALEIPTEALYGLYELDLEQFTLIQMNMLREVSRRLRYLIEKLADSQPEMLEKATKV